MPRYTLHRFMPGQEDHALEVQVTKADSEDEAIDQMPDLGDGSYWSVTDQQEVETKTFKVRVIESRTYEVEYSVEAEDAGEAETLAEIGETTMEVEIGGGEVINREVLYFL